MNWAAILCAILALMVGDGMTQGYTHLAFFWVCAIILFVAWVVASPKPPTLGG